MLALTKHPEIRCVNLKSVQYEENHSSLSLAATIIIVQYKEQHRLAFCLCPPLSPPQRKEGEPPHICMICQVSPKVI